MKKYFIFGMVALVLVGCGSHDKKYYEANKAEAEKKKNECESEMISLIKSGDLNGADKLRKDQECLDAFSVYQEVAKKRRELQREAERKLEAEKAAKKAAKFKKDYEEALKRLKPLDFNAFITKNPCRSGRWGDAPTADCKAYRELLKDKENKEIDRLINLYPGEALKEHRVKVCGSGPICDIAMTAEQDQLKRQVKHYTENKSELKKDFNSCHNKYMALQKAMKWNDMEKVTQSFKCRSVMEAARAYNIIGLTQPMP